MPTLIEVLFWIKLAPCSPSIETHSHGYLPSLTLLVLMYNNDLTT